MEEIKEPTKKIKKTLDEIKALKKEKLNKLKNEIKAIELEEKRKKIEPIIKKIKALNDEKLEMLKEFLNTL